MPINPDVTDEDYEKAKTAIPATAAAVGGAVAAVRRALISVLEDNGVDVNALDTESLVEATNLMVSAGYAAGLTHAYEDVKSARNAMETSGLGLLAKAIDPTTTANMKQGMDITIERLHASASGAALDLKTKYETFDREHPSTFLLFKKGDADERA